MRDRTGLSTCHSGSARPRGGDDRRAGSVARPVATVARGRARGRSGEGRDGRTPKTRPGRRTVDRFSRCAPGVSRPRARGSFRTARGRREGRRDRLRVPAASTIPCVGGAHDRLPAHCSTVSLCGGVAFRGPRSRSSLRTGPHARWVHRPAYLDLSVAPPGSRPPLARKPTFGVMSGAAVRDRTVVRPDRRSPRPARPLAGLQTARRSLVGLSTPAIHPVDHLERSRAGTRTVAGGSRGQPSRAKPGLSFPGPRSLGSAPEPARPGRAQRPAARLAPDRARSLRAGERRAPYRSAGTRPRDLSERG